MEEIINEEKNFFELLSIDDQDNYSLSKVDSTSLIEELKPKEIPKIKQPIKFILTKQPTPTVNYLQKKTLSKPSDSYSESENPNNGRWTKEEQKRFAEAVLKFGNDWKKIQNHVSSRNLTQVRSHAQKFLMKLKENDFLKVKGIDQNLSWTKIMKILMNTLTYEELKNVLFSVEEIGEKKKGNKKLKRIKKIVKKSNLEKNNENEFYKLLLCYENEEENKEEEEERDLQKFIECFNCPSGNITLNSSFEENSLNLEDNNLGYNYVNEIQHKYNKIL